MKWRHVKNSAVGKLVHYGEKLEEMEKEEK